MINDLHETDLPEYFLPYKCEDDNELNSDEEGMIMSDIYFKEHVNEEDINGDVNEEERFFSLENSSMATKYDVESNSNGEKSVSAKCLFVTPVKKSVNDLNNSKLSSKPTRLVVNDSVLSNSQSTIESRCVSLLTKIHNTHVH